MSFLQLPSYTRTNIQKMVTNEYVDSDYSINFFWQELSKLLETKKLAINHQNFTAWRKKEKKKIRNTEAINNLYSSQKIVYTIIIIIIIIIFFRRRITSFVLHVFMNNNSLKHTT